MAAQMTRTDREKRQKAFTTLQRFSDLIAGAGPRVQVTPRRALELLRDRHVLSILGYHGIYPTQVQQAAELLL